MRAPLEVPMGRLRFPDALVLIFSMILLAQLATYILPSGSFDREAKPSVTEAAETVTLPDGQTLTLPEGTTRQVPGRKVVPGSYQRVEAAPLPWHAALTSLPKGLGKAAEIIFFVFLVGGVIEVIKKTGAIDAMIGAAIRKIGDRPALLMGGMVTLFAVGSSTVGMAEEYMPFIPILVAMCLALKLDAVVAVGIVYIGAGVGYGCAALNPFTVMIAKDIAGQGPDVFFWPRWALLAVCIAIGVHHLMSYANRIRREPERSLVADVDYSAGYELPQGTELTGARIAVLVLFVAMIALFVWGVSAHGWYLVELAALFMGLALVSAVIARLTPNGVAKAFAEGAAQMTATALLIGFARTIEVVLSDAVVIDTVIHGIATTLAYAEALGETWAAIVAAWGMLVVQSICNLLIPSGSGQAYVTMPIMAPLADLTGVGRETAVLAYQFGDGFTNMVVPTNALLMGMLLLARIPYQRWLRFILPLMAKIYLVAAIVLAAAALMQLQ